MPGNPTTARRQSSGRQSPKRAVARGRAPPTFRAACEIAACATLAQEVGVSRLVALGLELAPTAAHRAPTLIVRYRAAARSCPHRLPGRSRLPPTIGSAALAGGPEQSRTAD